MASEGNAEGARGAVADLLRDSDFARSVFERITGQKSGPFTRSLVAEVIWRVVNDPSCPIRQPAGADAVKLARSN